MNKRVMATGMIILVSMLFSPQANFAQHTDKSNPPVRDSKKQTDDTSKQTSAGSGQNSGGSLSNSDRRFIMEAAHSSMAEVDLGKLAVERAMSPEVKKFGQHMIDDHSRANSELMQLASSKGVDLSMMASHASGSSASGSGASSGATGSGINPHSGERTGEGADKGSVVQTGGSGTNTSSASRSKGGDDAKWSQRHHALVKKLSALSGAEFDREYMRQMVKDHSDTVELFQREASRGSDSEVKAWAAKTLPAIQEHLRMAREVSAKVSGK